MIVITILITLLYCVIIMSFIIGFDRVKEIEVKEGISMRSFSIIIPFRNEEESLPELLASLQQLNYRNDYFEIIFVNDDSTDNSVELIKKFLAQFGNDIIIIDANRKSNSPKKDAIETAIKQAKFNHIITTDADCIVPPNWLQLFDLMIEKNEAQFIVAPVAFHSKNTFLDRFQVLDLMSLQGVTIGAFGIGKPFLCNGANLCYSKDAFNAVDGFEGNSMIASGDDIFLLEKVLKNQPEKVVYLKSKVAIVYSITQPNLKELIHQRIR
ncbi:MAG: glycosyltransferase, partial [Flavobacteriaceae bacterium]|nr:glycosyltransferase [Flavobacteriaceae bacterium]